ncbi:MAG TPA: LD-carboxypeptidase, partial [Rhodothermales bacterium]|nr:LD-carboxypeptidase [Rhodothermales bacterium]
MSHVDRPTLPEALTPGDRILVVAPSSAPRSEAGLQAGLAALRGRGYRVEPMRPAYAPHGYLAGDDAARLDEFNRALRDPDAKAIFCVRGGYGALRLLPHLDYEAARRHPKLLVGYSDITALHLALYHRAGWRGLSGPMVAVEWAEGQA